MKSDDSIFTCSKCDKRLEYGYSMACLHTICRECFDVRDTTESHTCNICHVSHDKSAISNIDNLIAWNNARWKKKINSSRKLYVCMVKSCRHEKMPNNFCSSHQDSKADFFCLTCESCYCVYCFLLKKHPASDDHRFCTDLEPAILTKLKNLSESNFLDKMDKLCGASNLEKRKIDQDLDEIEKIANEWRSEFESTIELINALCRSRRTPLVEIKKRTEIMEKIMSQNCRYS
uniref:B box-type domain-containing protein n=1 Tax=Romanomermis culicivorax TaxID=13658 RepID=A0A915HZF5_ROMCU